jgi:hypothetical protein
VIELHPGQKAVIASGFAENERVREVLELGAGRQEELTASQDSIFAA